MNTIILIPKDSRPPEAWGSLTEICRVHEWPYHSLKTKSFPFEYNGYEVHKVKFRSKS